MPNVLFLSKGKMYNAQASKPMVILGDAVEKYNRTLMEIQKKNEWKTEGKGAKFIGTYMAKADDEDKQARVEAVVLVDEEKLIYASTLGEVCGIYIKNPKDENDPERFIIRKNGIRVYNIDYDRKNKKIIASISQGTLEKNLAIFNELTSDYKVLTEGDSIDINPSFSKVNPSVVYYSSAGIAFESNGSIGGYGNFMLCRLDMDTGELDEILDDQKFDFIKPKELEDGYIYCIRRLKKEVNGGKFSPIDAVKSIVLMPLKLLKAIYSWLNFFTQRYTGESLMKMSKGPNPAGHREKNAEEIFIEGNLINIQKTLKENTKGEKYPGIAPRNWELIKVKDGIEVEVIKKGVLDYSFDSDNNLIYSNGRFIIKRLPTGEEEIICKADIGVNLSSI